MYDCALRVEDPGGTRMIGVGTTSTSVLTLRWGISCCALVHATPTTLVSQEVATQALRPVEVVVDAEFLRIISVRELSDGRVLVADAGDTRVYVVDFHANTRAQVGRQGAGPGEYRTVSVLYSAGQDSTLMLDSGTRRWVVIGGDRVVRTVALDPKVAQAGVFGGADERGFAIATRLGPITTAKDQVGTLHTTSLVRVHLASGLADTIAHLRPAPGSVETTRDDSGNVVRFRLTRPQLAVGEEATIFPDGWIAVARLDPYRVDWRAPDGSWALGSPLPFVKVRVDSRERRAHLTRMEPILGRPLNVGAEKWMEVLPPFQPTPLLPLPDGRVLVLRTPTARNPGNRYDIVNRRGRLEDRVELPEAQRLVGVGARGAYVVVTDEDGIQRLRRHPWCCPMKT